MSYDIQLVHPVSKKVLELDKKHQMMGGTYAIGGSNYATLNVTYNYSKHYRKLGEKGIREIYGITGADSIPILDKLADSLGNDLDDNYWEATEGNAKAAILQLIALAKMRPDGVWSGD